MQHDDLDRNDARDGASNQNLSAAERLTYMAVGLGLAAAGVKPRPNPLLNVAALGAGVYLALTGYRGSCPVKAALMDISSDRPRLAA